MRITLLLALFSVCLGVVAQEPQLVAEQSMELSFDGLLDGAKELLDTIEREPAVVQPAAAQALSFTVRDAVERALRENPGILRAAEEAAAAAAKTGQARSVLFPQVSTAVGFNYQQDAGTNFGSSFLTDLVVGGASDVEEIVRRDSLEIEQVLYAGGQIRAGIEASKYLAQSQEWKRVATLNDIEFQTKQAFYDCLLARALLQVAQDSVTTFERHLADAQRGLEVGLKSRFEELRARTELGSRLSEVIRVKNAGEIANSNLRRLLALPQDTPIALVAAFDYVPMPGAPGDLVSKALEQRPELLALDAAIAAAGQDVRARKGQYLPKAAASAEWTNSDGAGQFVIDGWTATAGLQWDIFTGGKRKYQVKEAEAVKRGLERQRDQVAQIVEFDVRQACIQVDDAVAQVRSERGNVVLAREGQRLSEIRFQEGVGTQADVLDAQLALTRAEQQLVRALRDYAVAHAALEKAIGKSWIARDEPSTAEAGNMSAN